MTDRAPDRAPLCSHSGSDRGKREPSDPDGLGCLDSISHYECKPAAQHAAGNEALDAQQGHLPLTRPWNLDTVQRCATCDGGGCGDCLD